MLHLATDELAERTREHVCRRAPGRSLCPLCEEQGQQECIAYVVLSLLRHHPLQGGGVCRRRRFCWLDSHSQTPNVSRRRRRVSAGPVTVWLMTRGSVAISWSFPPGWVRSPKKWSSSKACSTKRRQ